MTGTTGEATTWKEEGAAISSDLARAYGGDHIQVSSSAFCCLDETEQRPEDLNKIRGMIPEYLADQEAYVVLVTSLINYDERVKNRPPFNRYVDVEAPNAAVELGGVFFDKKGDPVEAFHKTTKRRVEALLRAEDLSKIARSPRDEGGEVVVVCGYSDSRIPSLNTVLSSGYVNTLVTDEGTLEKVFPQ